jgi:hypothetical protein
VNLLSGSKLERAVPCPGSVVLPQIDSDNPQRGRGTAVHAFLADIANGKAHQEALDRVSDEEHREACAAIDLSRLPSLKDFGAEVAFALDVRTGRARELGRNLDRDYSGLLPGEMPLTADLVGLLPDGEGVYVGDFKTGRVPVAGAKLNWQMRGLAVAATRTYGRSYAVVSLITVRDDYVGYDQATHDAFDLSWDAQELQHAVGRIEDAQDKYERGGQPKIVTGIHCRYCPAFAGCPAQTSMVRALAANPADMERQVMELLTEETAGQAWAKLKQVEEVVKRVRETLYAWAAEHPIDLGNGLVFGPVNSTRRVLSGPKVRNLLREMYDDAIAEEAVEIKTSQAAIERALKQVAPKGELAAAKRKVMDLLQEVGGITTVRSTSMKEHPVKGLTGGAADTPPADT